MIYVLLADGFEEIEAVTPIDIMRRAGLSVKTVSVSEKTEVLGAHGMALVADGVIANITPDDMEMLVLPGGAGHTVLDKSERVESFIDFAAEHDLYIAAICAAPSILGKRGLLNGKRATVFPGFEKYLSGAEITGEKVVTDGKIITGKGPGAAAEFGFSIVSTLMGSAEELKENMQY